MFNYVVDRFLAAFYPPALETHQKTVFSYETTSLNMQPSGSMTLLGTQYWVVKKVKNCYQNRRSYGFGNISRKKTNKAGTQVYRRMLIAAMETAGKLVESEEWQKY